MNEVRKCEACGRAIERRWKEDEPEMANLASFIQSLFDYCGEILAPVVKFGNHSEFSVVVREYALGASGNYDQPAPIDELVGMVRESFQRTFGEKNTGRRFWWREKPNVMMATEFETRRSRYALWLACAIEGLTEQEMQQLNHIPEGVSVSFKPV